MKEAMVSLLAGLQSLAHNDTRETPVDRLGAMAYAERESALASLGVDLIAFKYSKRQASHGPAVAALASILGWRSHRLDLNAGDCWRVAQWAIGEWVGDKCLQCRGATESPMAENVEGRQPMAKCPTCGGSGLRIWTTEERREGLGGKFDKPLDVAHKYIGAAEDEALRGLNKMLERWPSQGLQLA